MPAAAARKKSVPAPWRKLLRSLPGYDPFKDADGCWFDIAEAERRINFFPTCLRHIEGPKTGEPFELEPWQKAYIGNLFGWKLEDDSGRIVRRYRESLLYVPRGNGKTTISAGIILSCLFLDGEGGAQCYSAAATEKQAGLLMRHCANMIRRAPALAKRCKIYTALKSIVMHEDQASFYRALAAEAFSSEGFNTHCAVIDELHVQPNRELVDVLVESTKKKRAQPLIVYITTADWARESICNEIHDYAIRARDGGVSNPRFLPAVYEAKETDDWHDEKVWERANPNLGVSISVQDFRDLIQKATDIPALQNSTKRKHLNIRTQAANLAIDAEQWQACAHGCENPLAWRRHMLSVLRGMECFGGLDLGATNDLTALVLLFGEEKPKIVLPFFWVSADAVERRRRQRVSYDLWADQGFMTITEGNVTDYDFVRRDIGKLSEQFVIRQLGYDPWNAMQLAIQLQGDGLNVVEFRQGFASMAYPTRRVLEMVAGCEINHGGNPVLAWMAGNAATKSDPAGNIKFDKAKSTEKIDGIVGLAVAVGCDEASEAGVVPTVEVW